jgi:hypothetical protein
MNKGIRFFILSIVLLALILTSTWNPEKSGFIGRSVLSSRVVTPLAVQEKSAGQHGLIFIEFFAGN